jgi:hypothetical protein
MMEGHGLGSNWISNRLLLGILCLLVELIAVEAYAAAQALPGLLNRLSRNRLRLCLP